VRARGGIVSMRHLLTTLSASPADFRALLQLRILTPAKLFAIDSAANAGLGVGIPAKLNTSSGGKPNSIPG